MKRSLAPVIPCLLALLCAACTTTPPRCPTDQQLARTPLIRSDQKSVLVQGNFGNDPDKFIAAETKLKDGMTKDEVKKLGFDSDLTGIISCDSLGWLEASKLVTENSLSTDKTIDDTIAHKKQYSAIHCRAYKIQTRQDRALTYINNRDSCTKGIDCDLTIVFKSSDTIDRVVGVNFNKRPIQSANRDSSFLQVLSDIISPPKFDLQSALKLPK